MADGLHFSLALTLTHRKWGRGCLGPELKRVPTFNTDVSGAVSVLLGLQAVEMHL